MLSRDLTDRFGRVISMFGVFSEVNCAPVARLSHKSNNKFSLYSSLSINNNRYLYIFSILDVTFVINTE